MNSLRDIATLAVLFMSLFYEIFMLITYMEHRKKIRGINYSRSEDHEDMPSVTIIVPCFNEEKTVRKTIDSLMALDYPRSKLHIVAVDDGSTDSTPQVLEHYNGQTNFKIIHKENGGKHTALNLAIKETTTEFVGCLDADSYAKPDSLGRIMKRFDDPVIMAVVPALQVYMPKTIIQKLQKIEYIMGAFIRTILAELNALYVTPGPFSIFRKSVFEQIGYYKKAHNTEDMEMAMRMQSHGLRIACAHDAIVYTSSPHSIHKLYKQRVRWTSGFLNNVRDYKYMLFNVNYGNIGVLILPFMLLSALAIVFIAGTVVYDLVQVLHIWYVRYQAIGTNMLEWSWPSFSWFFLKTSPFMFLGIIAMVVILTFIVIGSRMAHENRARVLEVVSYMCLYSFIVPWWIAKSLYNVVFAKQLTWR